MSFIVACCFKSHCHSIIFATFTRLLPSTKLQKRAKTINILPLLLSMAMDQYLFKYIYIYIPFSRWIWRKTNQEIPASLVHSPGEFKMVLTHPQPLGPGLVVNGPGASLALRCCSGSSCGLTGCHGTSERMSEDHWHDFWWVEILYPYFPIFLWWYICTHIFLYFNHQKMSWDFFGLSFSGTMIPMETRDLNSQVFYHISRLPLLVQVACVCWMHPTIC